jgi:hypothetical protein
MIFTIRFLSLFFKIDMRYHALSALELICGMLPRGFTTWLLHVAPLALP